MFLLIIFLRSIINRLLHAENRLNFDSQMPGNWIYYERKIFRPQALDFYNLSVVLRATLGQHFVQLDVWT